ncbi:hypothetical protein ABZ618_16185 [Streptomyces roseolus]|uniref:hypothetical protein n=1 Tax=Streptomyces roseolus TaxID=67358 RepID=UPI0033C008B4
MRPRRRDPGLRSAHGTHLFLADGSRGHGLPEATAARLERWTATAHPPAEDTAPAAGLVLPLWGTEQGPPSPRRGGAPAEAPPLSSLSFDVRQACNPSCGHCHADEGRFGGSARAMPPPRPAFTAVDRLLAEASPGAGS